MQRIVEHETMIPEDPIISNQMEHIQTAYRSITVSLPTRKCDTFLFSVNVKLMNDH
jgi:hypothetical protein